MVLRLCVYCNLNEMRWQICTVTYFSQAKHLTYTSDKNFAFVMQNICKHINHTNIDNLENSHQLPTYDLWRGKLYSYSNSKFFAELRFRWIHTQMVKTLPSYLEGWWSYSTVLYLNSDIIYSFAYTDPT